MQPADDPERIFGERPSRRRYRTAQITAVHVPSPHAVQPNNSDATVVIASNVYDEN